MKTQQLKKYLSEFPFLSFTLGEIYRKPLQARDIAFIAVRPWESLDQKSRSVTLTAYRADVVESISMVGQISYHIVFLIEYSSGWIYEVDHIAFDKASSIENTIKRRQGWAMTCNTPLKLVGIVRIASAFLGPWSTPRTIEIFLYPENQP